MRAPSLPVTGTGAALSSLAVPPPWAQLERERVHREAPGLNRSARLEKGAEGRLRRIKSQSEVPTMESDEPWPGWG